MSLGQTLLALCALVVIGTLVLNTHRALLESNETMNGSEVQVAATTVAQSIIEEASGKLFDEVIADTMVTSLTTPTQLSVTLGPETGERYADSSGTYRGYNDVDDFNGLFLVIKSNLPAEAAPTPGANKEIIVPNIRDRFEVRVRVEYVQPDDLDGVATGRTWHKRLTVKVTNTTTKDTLVYPYLMSYWN
jgi:hypothetical protein